MRTFTYSEARRQLASLLDLARYEEVVIKRRNGEMYTLRARKQSQKSPLDVPSVNTKATMEDILAVIAESRERYGPPELND